MGEEHAARNVLQLLASAHHDLQTALQEKRLTAQVWLRVCQDLSAAMYRAVCAWSDREK